jgi:hypothetical protein
MTKAQKTRKAAKRRHKRGVELLAEYGRRIACVHGEKATAAKKPKRH